VGSVFSGPPPFTTVFPANFLGDQLRQIAIAISARNALGHTRRQLFYAQVPGNAYDFHGTQLASQDRLLGELDAAMTAFFDATVQLGVSAEVTTFIFSEFGRTIRINGDGSDHGWGNHYLVREARVGGASMEPSTCSSRTPELDFPLFSVSGNFSGRVHTADFNGPVGFTLARCSTIRCIRSRCILTW
jgi:hypothetical protein